MAQQTTQDMDSDLLMWLQDERGHLDQTGASASTEEGVVVGEVIPGLSHGHLLERLPRQGQGNHTGEGSVAG